MRKSLSFILSILLVLTLCLSGCNPSEPEEPSASLRGKLCARKVFSAGREFRSEKSSQPEESSVLEESSLPEEKFRA